VNNLFKNIKTITIRTPNWLGDNIMTLPALSKLKEENSHLSIKLFCPENLVPLWKLIGITNNIYSYKNPFNAIFKSFFLPLKSDAFIIFPNSFSSALSALLTRSKNRIGNIGNFRDIFLTHYINKKKINIIHQVDEYYYLIFQEVPELRLFPSIKIDKKKDEILNNLNIKEEKEIIALAPGAAWGRSKKWFEGYYQTLIEKIIELGYGIFIIGTEKEIKPYQHFEERQVLIRIFCNIEDIAYGLAVSSIAVGNDSGLMHLAAAVGCETIIIYGSTDWRRTYPRCKNAYVVSAEVPCQPCWKRSCPRKDYLCLKAITPELILKIIEKIKEGKIS